METTNLPGGYTTAGRSELLTDLTLPDPTKSYVFLDDFSTFKAAQWDNPAATPLVLADSQGGILQFNYAATSAALFTTATEPFSFTAGKQLWFKTSIFTSTSGTDFNNMDILSLGLFERSTNSDGVYFQRTTGTDDFVLHVGDGVTVETLDFQVANAFSDATPIELGFYYDGKATIKVFVNDFLVGRILPENIPFGLPLALGQNMDPINSNPISFEIDYFYAAQER